MEPVSGYLFVYFKNRTAAADLERSMPTLYFTMGPEEQRVKVPVPPSVYLQPMLLNRKQYVIGIAVRPPCKLHRLAVTAWLHGNMLAGCSPVPSFMHACKQFDKVLASELILLLLSLSATESGPQHHGQCLPDEHVDPGESWSCRSSCLLLLAG